MIIGFDCDGVLCDIQTPVLFTSHTMTDEQQAEFDGHYYRSRLPELNPEMFMTEGDIFYVLTSRPEIHREATEKFLAKFCPTYKELYMFGADGWQPESGIAWSQWNHDSRVRKLNMIKMLGCDIYIDDSPSNVAFYRENLDIPVIQYGGRLK